MDSDYGEIGIRDVMAAMGDPTERRMRLLERTLARLEADRASLLEEVAQLRQARDELAKEVDVVLAAATKFAVQRDQRQAERDRLRSAIQAETFNMEAYVGPNCGPVQRLRAALTGESPEEEEGS